MKQRLVRLMLAVCLTGPIPAAAQVLMGSYYAEIGPEDRRNSSGVALRDPGGILQQDRANVHRFGIRHPGDQIDRLFDTPDRRRMLANRGGRRVWTRVCEARGRAIFACWCCCVATRAH